MNLSVKIIIWVMVIASIILSMWVIPSMILKAPKDKVEIKKENTCVNFHPDVTYKVRNKCIDGVLYIIYNEHRFPHDMAGYMSVKYDAKTGKIITCNE